MILVLMPDPLRISLTYYGPSADDGTMPVADVVAALQGFSGAYGKIATRFTPSIEHRLRVSAVNHSSFEVLLLSLAFFGVQPNQEQLLEAAVEAGKRIVGAILHLIDAKKHTKGKPYTVNVEGNENKVVIINADNAKFEISREVLELLHDGLVDGDLSRIVSPLRRNEINSAKIVTEGIAGEITAEVTESDKGYFESAITSVTTTSSKDAHIEGFLVSLNKERNRGTFRLQDGTTVPYEYSGGDPYSFHNDFGRRGLVRVICDTDFDQNLRPNKINIKSVEHVQRNLPFQAESNSPMDQT